MGTRLHDGGDVHVRARQPDGCQQLIEELAGCADKGLAREILPPPGCLADQHDAGGHGAGPRHGLGARAVQRAAVAHADAIVQLGKSASLCGFCASRHPRDRATRRPCLQNPAGSLVPWSPGPAVSCQTATNASSLSTTWICSFSFAVASTSGRRGFPTGNPLMLRAALTGTGFVVMNSTLNSGNSRR